MSASDYELVKMCLSGEQGAFAEILSRYKKLVYNVIYNFMGNAPDVSDLFQEVFLKAYKSLARYNPDYRFATWVMKIATNVCLDRLREKGLEHADVDWIEDVSDERPNPEEQCLERERLERIRRAIRELPEDYRTPVTLFHQQGLSYEALAEVLGQPMSIIKNRLYRARLMLREKLCPENRGEASSW
jgi:RNA polymerase sigma factor (sigma-70 family)